MKSWFFEEINRIEKPLAKLTKKKMEKTKTSKIRGEPDITTNTSEIQRPIRE
jgi:hypothetical protein